MASSGALMDTAAVAAAAARLAVHMKKPGATATLPYPAPRREGGRERAREASPPPQGTRAVFSRRRDVRAQAVGSGGSSARRAGSDGELPRPAGSPKGALETRALSTALGAVQEPPREEAVRWDSKLLDNHQGTQFESRTFTNLLKTPAYHVLRIESTGASAAQDLKRRELLRQTGLPARDIRRIDPNLTLTTSAPTLLVSDNVILINLGQIRVIATRDHALLFEHHADAAKRFTEVLMSRIAASCAVDDGDHHSSMGDNHPLNGDGANYNERNNVHFELEVVEAALMEVTSQLDGNLVECTERVQRLSQILPQKLAVTHEVLEELRLAKQALVELDSRAGAIRQLLLEVVDDDEDVRGMMLSSKAQTPEEYEDEEDEVENLLEYYLQRCETCHSEAERLLENTRDLEDSITVSLSARRYEVNKLELMLSIATFATAVGALIAGIFGMNLKNKFEMSVVAFYGTAGGICIGVVTLCMMLYRYTRRKKIL